MNFKRYIEASNTWVDSHYIMGTDTDTLTTLPAVLYPNDTIATVGLKGQMTQSSIPSPTSPVMPQDTGERTGNVLDYTTVENTSTATVTQISGGISVSGRYYVRFRTVEFTVGSTYTMSWKANTIGGTSAPSWRFHYADNTYSSMPSSGGSLVVEKEVSELLLYVSTSANCVVEFTEIMLNTGSTPQPYEPYGYKLDISSANTTTPVYLGEVETTRRIKKLVLTGEETYAKQSGTTLYSFNLLSSEKAQVRDLIKCSHLPFSWSYSTTISIHIYSSLTTIFLNFGIDVMDSQPSGNTVAGLKEYIAAQYAAGTPVTVWYVLATEETGIVNEPLRKIGDYADEVSGISIPVTAGGDTISVDTTLQPSEVTATYKGWHPVLNVHERTNGAWT